MTSVRSVSVTMLDDLEAVLDERSFCESPQAAPGWTRLNERERLRGVRFDPDVWEYTRGRRGRLPRASRHRDPLTGRILELRDQARSSGREADLAKYSPAAQRAARAQRRGVEHGPPSPALLQHRADMAALFERLGVVQ